MSVEVLVDTLYAPARNFFSFSREKNGIVSVGGSGGLLSSVLFSEEDLEFVALKRVYQSLSIDSHLQSLLTPRFATMHSGVTSSIASEEHFLSQVIHKLTVSRFANGKTQQNQTVIQFCIEGRELAGMHFSNRRFLQESERSGLRHYIANGRDVFLSPDHALYDCGTVLLNSNDIELPLLGAKLLEDVNATSRLLSKIVHDHGDFASEHGELLVSQLPSPQDLVSSLAFIGVIESGGLIARCRRVLVFGSFVKQLEVAAAVRIDTTEEVSLLETALLILSKKTVFPDAQKQLAGRLESRLKSCDDPGIQAACVIGLLDHFCFSPEGKSGVDFVMSLICSGEATKLNLAAGRELEIFLLHARNVTDEYLELGQLSDLFDGCPEHSVVEAQIDRLKVGQEIKLLTVFSTLLNRGEYNKSLFLLNECFPTIFRSSSALRLAEIYIDCLLAVGQKNIADVVVNMRVFTQNVATLYALVKQRIAQGSLVDASQLVDRMESIEPLSELTKQAASSVSRAKLIESMGSSYVNEEDLQKLTGIEFEMLLQKKFESLGFVVADTPVTGDFGADIVVDDAEGTRFVIQCKRFASKVNLKAVQEVVAAQSHYGGDYGIVITNSEFLPSAIKLAASNNVELWDGERVLRFLAGDLSFSAFRNSPNLVTRPGESIATNLA